MTVFKPLPTRRLVVLGAALALLGAGSAIRTVVRHLAVGPHAGGGSAVRTVVRHPAAPA